MDGASIPQNVTPYANPIIFRLSLAAGRVYSVICGMLLEGQSQTIPNALIADVGRVSESTVSRVTWELVEHGLIERTWEPLANDGRGGYLITRLSIPGEDAPPIPQHEKRGSTENPIHTGSASDPGVSRAESGETLKPQKNAYKVLSHESKSQEESCACAFFDWLMEQPDIHPKVVKRVVDSGIGSIPEFQEDLTNAQTTPGVHTPLIFVATKWLSGERVPAYVPPEKPAQPKPSYRRGSSHMPQKTRPAHRPYLEPEYEHMQFDEAGHVIS